MRLEVFITIPETTPCACCGQESPVNEDKIWNERIGQRITSRLEEVCEELTEELQRENEEVIEITVG